MFKLWFFNSEALVTTMRWNLLRVCTVAHVLATNQELDCLFLICVESMIVWRDRCTMILNLLQVCAHAFTCMRAQTLQYVCLRGSTAWMSNDSNYDNLRSRTRSLQDVLECVDGVWAHCGCRPSTYNNSNVVNLTSPARSLQSWVETCCGLRTFANAFC